MIGGITLGSAQLQNVILVPGNNIIPARCVLDLKKLLSNLSQVISSESGALKNGNLEISASGNSTIYDGQHLDYYERSLNALTLSAQVPLLSLLVGALKISPGSASSLPLSDGPLSAATIANISSIISSIIS
jgi:hypothetical protein